MKERPILFSSPMVRAILEGRKTMTRRVCKPQPAIDKFLLSGGMTCHHGMPGDRIWVRETWAITGKPDPYADTVYGVQYKADNSIAYPDIPLSHHFKCLDDNGKWHPSIFMPRWASRITLEITAVRVERLQEITEEDAEREGATYTQEGDYLGVGFRNGFCNLWQSINGKKHPWESNPWVWVISFGISKD